MIRITYKPKLAPIPKPMTEEEVEMRLRCAVHYTDITALAQCLITMLYDLQGTMETEGIYRHENKLALTRATNRAVSIVNEITDVMGRCDRAFLNSYVQLYDELMAALDKAVLLQGSERLLSMIGTSCALIDSKLAILRSHSHTFADMRCVENLALVASDLRCIPAERHDLESIFRPILAKMLSKEEIESAKTRYMKYYNIKPRKNG